MRCKKCGTHKVWRHDYMNGKDILICPICDMPNTNQDEEKEGYKLKESEKEK